MKKICLIFWAAILPGCLPPTASAQLSFTSGTDPSAGPNANYAAVEYYNFSNAGGTGEFATGTQNNLYGIDYLTWIQRTYAFNYTYDPTGTYCGTYIITVGEGVGCTIAIPAQPANELQVLVGNSGIGDLTLTLTSIVSVADGTENFASGTTWSSSSGATLQAYLDSTTLFNAGFELYGTITLDSPANSTNYGNNLGSLIEINLANVPEPSTWALMAGGAGLLGLFQKRKI